MIRCISFLHPLSNSTNPLVPNTVVTYLVLLARIVSDLQLCYFKSMTNCDVILSNSNLKKLLFQHAYHSNLTIVLKNTEKHCSASEAIYRQRNQNQISHFNMITLAAKEHVVHGFFFFAVVDSTATTHRIHANY